MAASAGRLVLTRYAGGLDMPRHAHACAKVSFLLAGSVVEGSRESDRLCRAGDIVVKPAGIEHSDRVGPEGLCVLSIKPVEVIEGWERLVSGYRWLPFDPVIARIVRAYLHREFLSFEAIEECVAALNVLSTTAMEREENHSHWAFRAVEILHDTYDRPPSLGWLAQEIGAHPVALAQALRKRTGRTKTEIVHQIRVQRSLSLLQSTERVSGIAADLGFSDHAHFCRVFKRWMGLSPSDYLRTVCVNH